MADKKDIDMKTRSLAALAAAALACSGTADIAMAGARADVKKMDSSDDNDMLISDGFGQTGAGASISDPDTDDGRNDLARGDIGRY